MTYRGLTSKLFSSFHEEMKCSIGHSVLKTLIRAHFTPAFSTGQRFIATGSASNHGGAIYIYDVLTGDIVSVLEGHRFLVRDVSCHPFSSDIVSSSVRFSSNEKEEIFSNQHNFLQWDGTIRLWKYSAE
jgi:WD40 repeat protein